MLKEDIYSGEGIVLRKFPYKETSLIFSLFTLDWGRVGFLAKGALKSKQNKTNAYIEPGNVVDISFFNRLQNSLQTPKRIVLIEDYIGIKEDYDKYMEMASVLKIIYRILPELESNEEVYNITRQFLKVLNENPFNESLITIYLASMLDFLGYLPSFKRCTMCGDSSSDLYYSRKHESILCALCLGDTSNSIHIHNDSYRFLNHFHNEIDFERIKSLNLTGLKPICMDIIDNIHK